MSTPPSSDETIFAAALERPAGVERAAYLDEVCAGAAALRERIESLLRAHERAAQEFMATSAAFLARAWLHREIRAARG